jgi:hypothetical protein
MNDDRENYDCLAEGQEAEIEVTVLAVADATDGVPVMLAKADQWQVELWPATPRACREARKVACGAHLAAHVAKCPEVISDRSYGGLRKLRAARIRFARLLDFRRA